MKNFLFFSFAFLVALLWQLTETKIIGIVNGHLNIQCKLIPIQKRYRDCLSWQRNGEIIPDKYIRFDENYGYLNIPNATVNDTGFYYLAVRNEVSSCRRHVKVNVTDVRPDVFCTCIDLQTMNCSFTDSVYQFSIWTLWFRQKFKFNCVRKDNNFFTCQEIDSGNFVNNVSEWRIVGYNNTAMAEFSFHFDSRKYVTFVEAPDLSLKTFSNHSSMVSYDMDCLKLSYFNNLYGSSEIVYKILIEDEWGSKQEVLTKNKQFLVSHSCPDTTYSVTVSYQKEGSPLPEIWSKSNTVKFRSNSEVSLPLSLNYFKDSDPNLYRIYLQNMERCYKHPIRILKCGDGNLIFTKEYASIKDYRHLCKHRSLPLLYVPT